MADQLDSQAFSPEQAELWNTVERLWRLYQARDTGAIIEALHPRYVGWDMHTPHPHDRNAATQSAVSGPPVSAFALCPLSVEVYEHRVGVVHYTYTARMAPADASAFEVSGRWTEVYLREGDGWQMISVSGRPDQR